MPTLTRQELYDLAWSKPLTKLAADFGLSDVGLAKICERHPRGYWAKKEAGKKVKQAIFVQVNDPFLDRVEIVASHDKLPDAVREIVEQRRVERVASVRPHRTVMMTPPAVNPVEAPHPAIEATAKALRRRKPSNGGAVVAIGPGLCGISVGNDCVERVISILDALARVCDKRGIELSPADNRLSAQLRAWLTNQESNTRQIADPYLVRLIEWAREQLASLDAVLDPIRLADDLRTRKLFPETDELYDPLGEPPPERRWW
jgi:hypothetical protein